MKLKEFDAEAFVHGAKAVTREGNPVEFIRTIRIPEIPLGVLVHGKREDYTACYPETGKGVLEKDDLFLIDEPSDPEDRKAEIFRLTGEQYLSWEALRLALKDCMDKGISFFLSDYGMTLIPFDGSKFTVYRKGQSEVADRTGVIINMADIWKHATRIAENCDIWVTGDCDEYAAVSEPDRTAVDKGSPESRDCETDVQ